MGFLYQDIEFLPVDATESSAAVDKSLAFANGTEVVVLTIIPRDEDGNKFVGLSSGDFDIGSNSLTLDIGSIVEKAEPNKGEYTVELKNTTVETVTVTVEVKGVELDDKPTIEFYLDVTIAQSEISATPERLPSDGNTLSTVSVTLRDVNGDLVLHRSASDVHAESTGAAVLSAVVPDGDGKFKFTAKNATAQSVTISVSVDDRERE
jgi:adhesin/invasin